jgi:phosphopantothenoylcysteine decarboxylase/phosphopantothenate--cysteine ligase
MMGRRLVIGVSGGIAAFKTAALVSQLVQAGAEVSVVMTAAARQFIGPPTFAALTGRPVALDVFDPHYPLGAHIQLAADAQLLCIAPASADFLAKMAHGLADDLLSTLYLGFAGPVLVAPAMNDHMWQQLAVQRNVQRLRDDGVHFVDPESGWLSCRQTGVGRMAEPEAIAQAIDRLLPAPKSS